MIEMLFQQKEKLAKDRDALATNVDTLSKMAMGMQEKVPYSAFNSLLIFANFWRARSRLYQNKILQENMRLTTFFKLYKMCIPLHCCNLKI